jgi:hypothetical protein
VKATIKLIVVLGAVAALLFNARPSPDVNAARAEFLASR